MKSENSKKNYRVAFNQFLKVNNLKEENLKSIPSGKLREMLDNTFSGYEGKKTSILTKLSMVRSYLKSEFKIEIESSEERKSLKKFRLRKTSKSCPSREEIKTFLSFLESEYKEEESLPNKIVKLRNFILFKTLSTTGQRIGDILKMTVEEISKPIIHIKQEKTGSEVLLQNDCLSEIAIYKELTKLTNKDFIFSSGITKNPLSYNQAENILRLKSLEAIGKKFTSHQFRIYVISRLIELGYSERDIKAVSGHETTSMINYYDKAKPAIVNLPNLLMVMN